MIRIIRAAFLLIFAALGGSGMLLSLPKIALAQFKTPDQKSIRANIIGRAGVKAPAKTVNEAYYE
ncbi:MAG: hypothetical protein JO189_03575, partial [Deltaproteobacteria bacterium]|nr:hypothetical protein [Deltaproteobacteria bacterium]